MFHLAKCLCFIGVMLLGLVPSSVAFAPSTTIFKTTDVRHYTIIQTSIAPSIDLSSTTYKHGGYHNNKSLYMSDQNNESKSSLPVFLDPGTKGGAVVLSLLLFIIPIIIYQISTGPLGMDGIEVGRNIGVGFSVFSMLLWGGTYIFRVATKDMTYAKQLKDYEDAVIAKRLEELDEDEVQALVEDIERDAF